MAKTNITKYRVVSGISGGINADQIFITVAARCNFATGTTQEENE